MLEKSLCYKAVTSETEGSYASSPISTCKRLARNCDIYIGIFGQKYGTPAPRLGISFTEMEFDEAYRDNPEKILVYVQAGEKEQQQKEFLKKVRHASSGYFGRRPFKNDEQLIQGIKADLANFVKERFDIVRKRGLKVVKKVTPSGNDYASISRNDRTNKMIKDALNITRNKGFVLKQNVYSKWGPGIHYRWHRSFDLPMQLTGGSFPEDPTVTLACPFFVCSKRFKNKTVWLLIFAFPENFKAQYIDYLYRLFNWIGRVEYTKKDRQTAVNKFWYTKDVLCVFLVHERATEPSVRRMGNVCFKTEGGLYVGEPLSTFPAKMKLGDYTAFAKHMVFAPGTKNKTIMDLKISNILNLLNSLHCSKS